jgi:hypothetical protein
MTLRRVQWRDVTPPPKRARSRSSVPHNDGEGTPGGHVEHPLACAEINGVTEQFTHQHHIVTNHGVVTCRPCLRLARFNRSKIWHESLPAVAYQAHVP